MTRIFIEDQELDITQDIVYSLTFAIDDIVNIDSKATAFSKTIVIPGTNTNNTLFGNIFDFGNANFTEPGNNVFYNFDASRSAKARIEINGLEAMRGILRLMRIIHDKGAVEYEIALFGELGGLMSSIGNQRLEDLDFTKYNHQWNVTNIVDSWEETFTQLTAASGVDFSASLRRIRVDDELWNKLKTGDEISITGTANNDGIYTINRVRLVFFPAPGRTDIFVNEALVDGTNDAITIDKLNAGFGDGYVYPLINYGKVTDSVNGTRYKDWQFKAFRPAIFVKEYIDRIITGAGYTWKSDFFNTSFFNRLIIPNNDIALQNISSSFYIEADTSEALSETTNASSIDEEVKWDNTPTLNNFTYSNGKYTYTPSDSKSISFFINVVGSVSRTLNNGGAIIFYLSVNGIDVQTQRIEINGRTANIDFTINHNATVRTGDVVYLGYRILPYTYYEFVSGGGFGSNSFIFTFQANTWNIDIDATLTAEPNPKGYIEYSYDDLINMNHVIPKNVFQRDFFLSILKLFNLMVVEDKGVERRLIIEPDAYFYNTNRATYLNWTDKVDRSQPITITPMSETNARYYQLTYKSDNDFYNEEYKKKFNENYGDRIFDNELEFAKDTQKLEVIFSSSVLTGFDATGMIFPTICKITNDEEESIAHNIRIMQIKVKDIAEYTILNDAAQLGNYTKYLYAGHLDDPNNVAVDLNFGATRQLYFDFTTGDLSVNMFNAFYSPYMAEITDKNSRLVTASVKLNDIDIFQLDFRKFIFIDGIIYRLKKIIDWAADNICKVELLRAINTTYVPLLVNLETINACEVYWAKTNLYTKFYNNGDPIPFAATSAQWDAYDAAGTGCYAYFKFDVEGSVYDNSTVGLFYNQYAIQDSRGLIPNGWRMPDRTDFQDLNNCFAVSVDLMATGATWWSSADGTNLSGFAGLGLGAIEDTNGTFIDELDFCYLWTNELASGTRYYAVKFNNSIYDIDEYRRGYGFNIRLIKI